jgi:radical SAM protein with 4Fe4S-binding SPASM domain
MDMSLFKNIIDQAKEVNPREVMPFLNGEPFLDRNLTERIAYVNETLPKSAVILYSNGSLLTEEKIEELKHVKVSGINFSINAISDAARMSVMGLPLSQTVENILHYHDACPNTSLAVSTIMDTVYISADGMREFADFWQRKAIKPNLFYNGNWAGKTRSVEVIEGSCVRPDNIMTILADGTVALCCYDLNGEVSFGNVKDKTIKEIWNSSELEDVRFAHIAGRRNELKLCSTCTMG